MNVILAYVTSLDGFLTNASGQEAIVWASPEDQKQFKTLGLECGIIIVGSNTYEAHKEIMKPEKGLLRIVMTRDENKYSKEHLAGTLEFTSLSPLALVQKLEASGKTSALVAGGPKLYAEFFKEKLVTELRVTMEPYLFGTGLSAACSIPSDIHLQLLSSSQLNTNGTLLLTYKVLY